MPRRAHHNKRQTKQQKGRKADRLGSCRLLTKTGREPPRRCSSRTKHAGLVIERQGNCDLAPKIPKVTNDNILWLRSGEDGWQSRRLRSRSWHRASPGRGRSITPRRRQRAEGAGAPGRRATVREAARTVGASHG